MEISEPVSLSRKERERLSRRNAMMAAAQSVFAEKGFGPATLEEIASRAEFGKGTIYNYFPGGKEEILFALLDRLYDGLIELINTHFLPSDGETDPTRNSFREYLVKTFSFLEHNDDLFLIAMKEAHRHLFGDDPEKAAYFRRQHDRLVSALAGPLQEAMDRSEIRKMPANAAAHMLLGNINGLYTHVCLCSRYDVAHDSVIGSPKANGDFMMTMLFDGLLTND